MSKLHRTVRFLLLGMIVSFMFIATSGARLSPGFESTAQRPGGNPHLTWRELGIDEAKLECYRRRKIPDGATMRMAPGGPDPQHHSGVPPALS